MLKLYAFYSPSLTEESNALLSIVLLRLFSSHFLRFFSFITEGKQVPKGTPMRPGVVEEGEEEEEEEEEEVVEV